MACDTRQQHMHFKTTPSRAAWLTLKQASPAHLKLCCGRVANADSCVAIILPPQVAKVLLAGAQGPCEDLSEATHGAFYSQQLHKLIQWQLLAYCDCGRYAQTHIVVAIGNSHILQLDKASSKKR